MYPKKTTITKQRCIITLLNKSGTFYSDIVNIFIFTSYYYKSIKKKWHKSLVLNKGTFT